MSPPAVPAPAHPVRTLTTPAEVAAAWRVFGTAMVAMPFDPGDDVEGLSEPGRTLGVALDGDLVGTAESYAGWMVVPGGRRVSHAAVTHVGVLPTHTRRGVLSALMAHQLRDLAGRGEVVASLRASEATIYERYGYAVASRTAGFELDRRRARLRPTVPPGGPVRLVAPDRAEAVMAAVGRSAGWVGAIDRSSYWWNIRRRRLAATPGPHHVVVHGPEGAEDGFATYRPADPGGWFSGRPREVVVDDLVALDHDAHRDLVRHFVELDLVDVVRFATRPVDEPLAAFLVDRRAVQHTGTRDETWLRIVDVPAALAARTYRGPGSVVIEVRDPLLPANDGAYRVSAAGGARTDAPAELSTDVSALAAAYLGGEWWSTLARAGRVRERRPGALAEADELFAATSAPHAGISF